MAISASLLDDPRVRERYEEETWLLVQGRGVLLEPDLANEGYDRYWDQKCRLSLKKQLKSNFRSWIQTMEDRRWRTLKAIKAYNNTVE